MSGQWALRSGILLWNVSYIMFKAVNGQWYGVHRITSCLTGSLGSLIVVRWFLDACYAAIVASMDKRRLKSAARLGEKTAASTWRWSSCL